MYIQIFFVWSFLSDIDQIISSNIVYLNVVILFALTFGQDTFLFMFRQQMFFGAAVM